MLSFRRPAGARSEAEFVHRFLGPRGVKPDGCGNLIRRIGSAPVLWSCHTDSVHTRGGRQNVRVDGGVIRLAKGESAGCLGADDGAGVWLMCEMIRAGVEGLYIFHAAEEKGGIGSSYIATETPELLAGIQCAIALDRKGRTSVITHQGRRCASDRFATALGDALGLGMKPDDGGLFTDTANYTDLIGECTNLSVGYEGAHSERESLDVGFLLKLRDALIALDVSALPIVREAGEVDPADARDALDYRFTPEGSGAPLWCSSGGAGSLGDYETLLYLCRTDPERVADVLTHYGITPEDIDAW